MKNELLKNKTKEEALKDIDDRLFMLDMIDMQTSEDKKLVQELRNLKREIENDKFYKNKNTNWKTKKSNKKITKSNRRIIKK